MPTPPCFTNNLAAVKAYLVRLQEDAICADRVTAIGHACCALFHENRSPFRCKLLRRHSGDILGACHPRNA